MLNITEMVRGTDIVTIKY